MEEIEEPGMVYYAGLYITLTHNGVHKVMLSVCGKHKGENGETAAESYPGVCRPTIYVKCHRGESHRVAIEREYNKIFGSLDKRTYLLNPLKPKRLDETVLEKRVVTHYCMHLPFAYIANRTSIFKGGFRFIAEKSVPEIIDARNLDAIRHLTPGCGVIAMFPEDTKGLRMAFEAIPIEDF